MSARAMRAAALGVAAMLLGSPVSAQLRTVGVGADFMGYTFDEGLGADAAQLLMVPLAIRAPLGDAFVLDLYSAWAEGRVESEGVQYVMNGVVDTRLKLSYQVRPWAVLSLSAALPTGDATHDGEEARVASVLSADLLGFREATWGSGSGLTPSLATAVRAGEWGIGIAGAYSVRTEFQPQQPAPGEDPIMYRPGNEMRLRVGVDRNIGTNTLTAGATAMNFSADQADGRNLFQAGLRARFDASYLFRAGAGVWSVYVADVVRQNGDLTLTVVQAADTLTETSETPSQNLVVVGFVGTVGVGGNYVFRPRMDLKYQTRTAPDGSDQGSGWILAAGGDFPIRLFGLDFFPKARALYGAIKDGTGTARSLLGMEFTGTIQVGF